MSGKPIGLPLIMVIASRYFTGILSIRAWWRPPSKGVLKNSSMMAAAVAVSMKRPGITSTLASLCWRMR